MKSELFLNHVSAESGLAQNVPRSLPFSLPKVREGDGSARKRVPIGSGEHVEGDDLGHIQFAMLPKSLNVGATKASESPVPAGTKTSTVSVRPSSLESMTRVCGPPAMLMTSPTLNSC